ncbi:extracellular solute-binding protein [Mobilitalea sibirica]|uniref:Extracellular solute-binding protein n=1 Tax=Mobilitalea sibirica TaxID=1462919 RepID=A0A8J7H400_9FIRM|nr:extracellular solute-binding protein [Mobilitalea sibirica]MBH1941865.1 extracellular solute-binding protein [Mobilitalea sibirica]
MRTKRYGLAAVFVLAVLALTACVNSKTAEPIGVLSAETLFEGEVNLNVYAVQEDEYIAALLERFQYDMFATKAAGVTITWFESVDTMIQTVTTEMMGGGGPDVLFFNPLMFESSYNLLKNNMFADLNPIIEETEYDLSSFNSKVIDAGVYNDKRIFMPINYDVEMFLAVDSFLNGISFENMNSMEDFMAAHENYILTGLGDDNRFNFANPFSLSYFLEINNVQVVDFKEKKVEFDENELKIYVDWYKEIQKHFIKSEADLEGYSNSRYGPILEGDMVFLNGYDISNHNRIKFTLSLLKALSGDEEARLYSLSDLNTGSSVATIRLCGAVNKNSKHQKEAFELIKCALSKFMQQSGVNYNLPVRNTVLDYEMLELSNKTSFEYNFDGTSVPIIPLTEKELNTYTRYLKEPGRVIVNDNRYNSIMEEAFKGYMDGTVNWDKTLKKANHLLKVYIYE